jgi:hypothetical protein
MEVHVMTALDVRPLARLGTAVRTARLSHRLWWPATACLVALVELGAGALGLWWVTAVVGGVVGASTLRRRLWALMAGTAVGWLVGILLQSGGQTIQIGGVVSAEVLNARSLGWLIVVVAVVYAFLLALAGAWIGASARRLIARDRARSALAEPVAVPDPAAEPEEARKAEVR